MNGIAVWKRVRRSDRAVAPFAVVVSALVGVMLLWLAIGGIGDPATLEQENAAEELALGLFGCWLLGGAVLYAVLGMFRALLGHLAALLVAPLAVIVALLVLSA
ncbi:hypothetical protein ROS62_10160 [Streptomyces sp. DSM 41972]|uniref:Uncharacterized protein n=1 Tax=Streptomyces althioticus subsp. attaecolombicae TaxID=3075534 RepID=A0ABU3HX42_9ACTN|nr:hypothetical protein [Streptomyces sp. DSM 41972]SCD91690.1 hypothetical protein GA0115238_13513 [Streptomyces sp. di50b]SCE42097.1 hypothetical protein GA0115245_13473 [Streptomyces sp. di188]